MATHDDIGLSQPAASTITHRLDVIRLDHNSTIVLREILVVGSPETTNALAAVLNTTPASTAWALAVREVGGSTTVNVSSLAGAVTVRSSAADALVTVYQSTAADLNVTVANFSTTVNVSSLAGAVQARVFDSSGVAIGGSTAAPAANDNGLAVRQIGYVAPSTQVTVYQSTIGALRAAVYQSTAADLNVTVAGYSTTANVSSVSGIVTVRPSDTNFASSAGFHFDSSGALQITGASASTQVAVSSVAGVVAVNPSGSSNSSMYFSVRLTNGTAFLTASQDYTHGSTLTASTVAAPALLLRASSTRPPEVSTSDMWATAWGTLRGAAVHTLVTDSGVSVMDSTESALKVNVVAGSAGGSTIVTVSTGSVRVHQSTAADLNVTVANFSTGTLSALRDRDQSTQVAAILNATQPASTAYGLVVRIPAPITDSTESALRVNVVAGAAGGSTIMTVSTGSVRVHQSTAADLNVTVAGYSTTANVSSVSGIVTIRPSDTNYASSAGFHFDTAGSLMITGGAAGSTQVTVYQSTVGALRAAVYQSTAADLNVTVAGYSTTVNVSSVTGPVTVRSSAADALVTVYQSTAADLNVTVAGYSTTVNVSSVAGAVVTRINTSSGGAVEGSTTTPPQGALGLHVRQVLSSLQSTSVLITSTHSTALYDVISSVAAVSHKVYAYMVTSTHTVPSTLVFMSSNAIDRWHVGFGSGSSGMTGANLAMSPVGGGFLFRTDAQNALRVRIEGGSSVTSTVIARISVSYFTE